ncbi:MAG: DUF1289 domain-containing protein [Wenzhouxiangellaceae bacterium]|nr:DUF1289 domain-containing protein [Wenzhouxiangellaceae bacterium]
MSDPALQLQPIESPCVSICRLDDDGVCVGCFRTAGEIAGWLGYSDDERRAIMQQLPARAEQLFGSE